MSIRYKIDRMKYRANAMIGEAGRRMVRFSQRDSNCLKHAEREWAIAFPGDDEMQALMGEHVLDMVAMFALQGHSGFSASYARQYIDKALGFEAFSPLTGEESEWAKLDYHEDMQAQNKRCGHVFRRADGSAYDSEGRIFRDPDGACYTSKDSRVDITFPYVPTREYVDVPA